LPIKELLDKNEEYLKAWEMFIEKGELRRDLIRDIIAESWIRSKTYNINPFMKENNSYVLTEEEYKNRYKKFSSLIKRTRPFMESLYKLVGNTGFLVRLTDKDGYVLEFIGDMALIDKNKGLNAKKGCNVRENNIGTNAIGLSLITKKPVHVIGSEHFCKGYHELSSAACPIRDKDGKLLGILSMTGEYERFHPHTLGMIVAASEAIENELKLELTNKQLALANKHFKAIMESISEGLICVNEDGIVTDINLFAKKILSLKEQDILGKDINSFIYKENRNKILKVIKNGRRYEEEELYFKGKNNKRISCIATVTPIQENKTKKLEGVVITFKESKVIHNLINKIVGAEARFQFEDILGESPAIKDAIKIAKKASRNNTTLLLNGESGTGKELFAQSIHNASSRKNKPFIFLNCGAIPRELVASELFGYVEGAFTGAKRGGHPGKFELADGGTIFLDEIGDMPLDTQANLLRVLETKEVVRVGGHDIIPIDVRVIAATHKDLKKEVEQGNFREDLFYRLNVVQIKIPPLRERKEDIKIYIDYFIEKFSIKMGKVIKDVSEGFYKGVMNYNWPGNVRELQNVMQYIINIIDNNEVLTSEHLPSYMKTNNIPRKLELEGLPTLDEVEKITIERTIQEVKGNLAKAARILGIGRSSLYRKMDKYNIKYVSK